MKIDCFCHILPPKYLAALKKKGKLTPDFERELANDANTKMEVRLRLMDRYPGVLQVLSISQPPLEKVASPQDAVELAQIANDELAELIIRYPDNFIAGVACLPLNDLGGALEETDRAINQLKFRGVQIYSNIGGDSLDAPKFRPLYEKMAGFGLPIWLHPCLGITGDQALFGWPYETASAMLNLVSGGVFRDYPDIKFIAHHAGSMVPFFEGRIRWIYPLLFGTEIRNPLDQFRKFYCDTAVYGSASAIKCAHDFFGPEHLLFGTDMPLGPGFGLTAETIRSIEEAQISEIEKEMVFWRNAVDLLGLAI